MNTLEKQNINITMNKYCYFCEKKHNNSHACCTKCYEELLKEIY